MVSDLAGRRGSLLFSEEIFFLSIIRKETSAASRARVFIKAPSVLNDGESGEFRASINSDEPVSYQWSYEAANKAKTPASVNFSSPNAATTQLTGAWYARKGASGCSSDFSSNYTIKLKIRFQNGEETVETMPLTVMVPHNWGGAVNYPETVGAAEVGFDEQKNIWRVRGIGTLYRMINEAVIRAEENSQFYHKIKEHEETHVRQFTSGIFSDLFQIDDLMPNLLTLSDSTQQRLEQKVFQVVQTWRERQRRLAVQKLTIAEKEAYAVSDAIEPRYLFNNCERFK